MGNNVDVIASLINYILNQHATANAMKEAYEGDPEFVDEYNQLLGAMTAWYFTMEAITHYIELLVEQEGNDDKGTGSTESPIELPSELLQERAGDDA